MSTNKKVVPIYKNCLVLINSTLHNIVCKNSTAKVKPNQETSNKSNIPATSLHECNSMYSPMKLRSQTRQQFKPKDENDYSPVVRKQKKRQVRKTKSLDSSLYSLSPKNQKNGDQTKKAIESLKINDHGKRSRNSTKSQISKKLKSSDQIKETKEPLDSSSQLSPRSLRKTRLSDQIKVQRNSLDSSIQLSQRSLKKPKTSDIYKESVDFKHLKEIETILTDVYLNIKERFYIKSRARCVENFQHCKTIHSKDVQICDYYSKNSSKMFLAETRVLNFLKALDGMMFRNVFPGVELIIELIGTILTYDNIDKSATNECIIAGSLNTFHRIMILFPPCVANIKIEYQNLITESCYKSEIISLPNFEFQNGIFWNLIEMLENLIENDVENNDVLNLSQQSEDGIDFYTWEKRQNTQYYRHNIPRDDKIDRIFYVLHFLIDLMEYEFSIWFQRHQFDGKYDDQAIITSVIWPNDLPGTLTVNVKRIITLFTKFVAVNFPESKIKILSSILTQIGNVMLHMTAKNYYNIYPTRNFIFLEALSKEMVKTVMDIQPSTEHSKVKLCCLIVTHLELPALKMLFGNGVIDKIENVYTQQLNLKKLHENLINPIWKVEVQKTRKKLDIRKNDSALGPSSYPIYSEMFNKTRKSCETINNEEYIVVLFETFTSYLNYFKLDKIMQEINNPFDEKSNSSSSYRNNSPLKLNLNNSYDTITKIDYKLVEKNLNRSLKMFDKLIKLNLSTEPPVPNSNNNVPENVKFDNASLIQYHSDIEFLEQIVEYIRTTDPSHFKIFKEFIKESNLIDY